MLNNMKRSLGVHFKAGGAFPFLGAEASELNNAHANLLDLWGTSGLELRERLCTASTPNERFRIMDATLRSRLQNHAIGQLPIQIALKMIAMIGKRASVRAIDQPAAVPFVCRPKAAARNRF
jgi:hypothetical protein